MKKAYIHIGTEKTGTTSLQNFFSSNRKKLLASGIYYPVVPGERNHFKLAIYSSPNRTVDLRKAHGLYDQNIFEEFEKTFLSRLNEELKRNTFNSVLFSNEHLSSRCSTVEQIRKIKSITDYLELDPHIIIYLRRQDELLVSSYSTMIKSGSTINFNLDLKLPNYDYYNMLNKWTTVFGKDKIKIRPYEKNQWHRNNIYFDFAELIGINLEKQFTIPLTNKNSSLDRYQLKFLASFNKHLPVFVRDKPNTLRGNIVKLLENNSTTDKIRLSKESILEILSRYKETNKLTARKFLGRDYLFTQEYSGSSISDSLPELTADKAIEIITDLWRQKQNQINELTNKIK